MRLPKNSEAQPAPGMTRIRKFCRLPLRSGSWLAVTAMAVVLFVAVCSSLVAAPGTFLEPGAKAPVTSLEDLHGKRHQMPPTGSWSIVFFWSLFCHLCIEEIPHLIQETDNLASPTCQPFFVSLDTARMRQGLLNFLAKRHLKATVLLEEIASSAFLTADQWGVRTTPAVFLVDPDGMIRFSREGPFDIKELLRIMYPISAGNSSQINPEFATGSSHLSGTATNLLTVPPTIFGTSTPTRGPL